MFIVYVSKFEIKQKSRGTPGAAARIAKRRSQRLEYWNFLRAPG